MLLDSLSTGRIASVRFSFDVGTYDIPGFLESNRRLRDTFKARGLRLDRYKEFHEGHSWGNWRAHLDDILTLFFPASRLRHE